MQIKIANKLELVTYSKDLICIKQGNKTVVSYGCLIGALKWLDKNGYKGIKNRVQEVLIDFSCIDIGNHSNSFNTENYKVEFDEKREFTVTDLSNRNNVRWFYDKGKMLEKVYFLEINRLNVNSFDLLIDEIGRLNHSFSLGLKSEVR